MPIDALISGGMEAWVMIAGCSIRLSTPPRLSASEKSSHRSRNRRAGSSPPLHDSRHDAPETIHLASGNAMLWMGFKARIVDLFNMRVAFEELSNLGSALTMLAHAQWQGLKGAQHPK